MCVILSLKLIPIQDNADKEEHYEKEIKSSTCRFRRIDHDALLRAGACSRLQRIDGKWQIRDLEWQKNFVQRAKEYQRDIVPIYFEGKNSKFFYTLAYIRKLLHIKLNIEMLYLVDEMYGAHGKHFKVHVLPPIPYSTFDNSRTPKQWAEYVKSIVYATNHTSC